MALPGSARQRRHRVADLGGRRAPTVARSQALAAGRLELRAAAAPPPPPRRGARASGRAPDRADRVRHALAAMSEPSRGPARRSAACRSRRDAGAGSHAYPALRTAAMSVSTSPKRFEATTTSRLIGFQSIRRERVHERSGRPPSGWLGSTLDDSSQSSCACDAFDFVALLCDAAALLGDSNAYFDHAAHALRVLTSVSIPTSWASRLHDRRLRRTCPRCSPGRRACRRRAPR